MNKIIQSISLALVLVASTTCAFAEDTMLFNGKDLKGWTFQVSKGENKPKPVQESWVVQKGLLISTGACTGFLKHEVEFENYVLTLEWRSMKPKRNGLSVGGSGSVFVHTSDEMGSFHSPKSVEISLFNDTGSVYFRDVKPFSKKKWAFRAPDFADDAEKEMGEWNQTKLICRGNRLTVFVNGTPVNQMDGLNLTKGAIALKSQRGAFQAPSYYRNIRVQPLSSASVKDEKTATTKLAKFKALVAKQEAAEEAKRGEKERRGKTHAEKFARQWATIKVPQEIDFTTDARKLPFPADTRELEFKAKFGDIELKSSLSLAVLSKFYRTQMAKRGWKEVKKKRDKDSVEVTFKHGQAEVELSLDKESDGVEISLDCRGLSFKGTNDPAGLVALGISQPRAYVFLQKEIKLPSDIRDLEFDGGNRCLFKSGLGLQKAFDEIGKQLRAKGYKETRRPIVSKNRRYTEFAKGRIELSVNIFSNDGGSRAILTYEEK